MADDRIFPEFAIFLAAACISQNDRQGDLAFAEIVTGILAHGLPIGTIVDRVVNQLKRNAEIAAIAVQSQLDLFIAFCDNRRYPAGGGK